MINQNGEAHLYTVMENMVARFLHAYNYNDLYYIGKELLLNDAKTCVSIEGEGMNCAGYSSIISELRILEDRNKTRCDKQFSIWASPRYQLEQSSLDKKMICDLYTYRFYFDEREGKHKCELIISQLIVTFLVVDQTMKIINLLWKDIQSMIPWDYELPPNSEWFGEVQPGSLPEMRADNSPEDVLQIRNLQNYFFERKMNQTEQLFCDQAMPSLYLEPLSRNKIIGKSLILNQINQWRREEVLQNGYYLFLGITAAPIIEVNLENRSAEGLYFVETFHFNNQLQATTEKTPLIRYLNILKASYCLENGEWKIRTMDLNIIGELPRVIYTRGRRYDRMSQYPNSWNLDICKRKGRFIEDSYKIENILNQWVYHCRCGKLVSFYEEYMKNREIECRMLIRSQGERSKILSTEAEIIHKLSEMDQQFHDLMYSYHTATTPIIEIEENGNYAKATWFDHSATNLFSMATTNELIPYMVFVAKYVHQFRRIEGKWYLVDFYWEPLISLPDWEFNLMNSKGFVSKKDAGKYKNPYDI